MMINRFFIRIKDYVELEAVLLHAMCYSCHPSKNEEANTPWFIHNTTPCIIAINLIAHTVDIVEDVPENYVETSVEHFMNNVPDSLPDITKLGYGWLHRPIGYHSVLCKVIDDTYAEVPGTDFNTKIELLKPYPKFFYDKAVAPGVYKNHYYKLFKNGEEFWETVIHSPIDLNGVQYQWCNMLKILELKDEFGPDSSYVDQDNPKKFLYYLCSQFGNLETALRVWEYAGYTITTRRLHAHALKVNHESKTVDMLTMSEYIKV